MTHRLAKQRRHGDTNLKVLIAIGLVAAMICGGVFWGLILPAVIEARARASMSNSLGHFKSIGIALHYYHDTYGEFPPAYLADESGKPVHSWRVLLLPWLEHSDLYDRYDFDEPWDGPNNRLLLPERPSVYANPRVADGDPTKTAYQALVGMGASFDPTVPKMTIRDITDGSASTVMLTENFGQPVIWMQPDDTSPADFLAGKTAIGIRHGETVVMMADTSTKVVQQSALSKLKPWTTRAAGD